MIFLSELDCTWLKLYRCSRIGLGGKRAITDELGLGRNAGLDTEGTHGQSKRKMESLQLTRARFARLDN